MTTSNRSSELVYQLNDRPPLPQTIFAALQHLLAMFVAVITPSLIICQSLGVPADQTNTIISMSLFASGVSSFIQSVPLALLAPACYRCKAPALTFWVQSSVRVYHSKQVARTSAP